MHGLCACIQERELGWDNIRRMGSDEEIGNEKRWNDFDREKDCLRKRMWLSVCGRAHIRVVTYVCVDLFIGSVSIAEHVNLHV